MRTTSMEEQKLKKDRNCLHCEHFFDCEGKPAQVKDCINYKERKEGK